MMDTHVVIMAGGIGSRLWPLSTPERPKQFIDVLGVGKSLIQLTVERFLPVCAPDRFWVVTSEKYVDIVREQLPDIPADALVLKTDAFADAIRKALAATEGTDAIVTVGITPTRPEIFVWNVKTITRQLRAYAPQIAGVMDTIAPALFTDAEASVLRKLFPTCDKISIDYAVMEKSRNIYVVAGDFAWSDLGSWGSIKTHIEPDAEGNAVVGGDVRLFGCKDCFVHTAGEKTVVVEGLEGYIVAESADRLLVCRLSEEQRIKEFSS